MPEEMSAVDRAFYQALGEKIFEDIRCSVAAEYHAGPIIEAARDRLFKTVMEGLEADQEVIAAVKTAVLEMLTPDKKQSDVPPRT